MCLLLMRSYQAANPYHNNIHAADVLSRLASIIRAEGFFTDGSVASKCYLLTAVIAAAVHDYAHPGLSNDYEVAFDTPVSRRYNEQAVLEHQSVYFALELLRNDERLNFMSHLAQPLQRTIISRIIQLVPRPSPLPCPRRNQSPKCVWAGYHTVSIR